MIARTQPGLDARTCDQCGQRGKPRHLRRCGTCHKTLHHWCALNHLVDYAGDGIHDPPDDVYPVAPAP